MDISSLKPAKGSKKKRKRVGRGPGSGHGKTSCKGHKGQKARSGARIPAWFEGGQMPLTRRVPKRGFKNIFRTEYQIVNVKDLDIFYDGETVTIERLKEAGLIKKARELVKILGDGEINKTLNIEAHKFSEAAAEKIKAAGGKITFRV